MGNQRLEMSLEEYLRGKLNVPSGEGAPLDIADSEYAANISPNRFAAMRKMFAVIDNYAGSRGVNLEPANIENFSIAPMPRKKSPGYNGIVNLVREYYESRGMTYDEKASTPSRNNPDPSIWFKTPEGKRFYVTYTPGFLDSNMDTMELLFSASFCQF